MAGVFLNPYTEMSKYRESLKHYWDFTNVMETQRQEGIQEGIEQGLKQGLEQGIEQGIEIGDRKRLVAVIKNLWSSNQHTIQSIADITEIDVAEVQQILQEIQG